VSIEGITHPLKLQNSISNFRPTFQSAILTMSSPLTYLVTGANRGIGKGFTTTLLQRPNTTVIAAVRDLARSSTALDSLPKASGAKLILVKLDSASESDPKDVVAELKSKHAITSVDIVIANAGISHSGTTVANTTADALRDHINVNTLGPILLFQAVKPLLEASKSGNPIFVGITSAVGSIGLQEHLSFLPNKFSPYAISKAALNWSVHRLHFEEPWLTSYVVHPGIVWTDMSAEMDKELDFKAMGAVTVEESVEGILKTLDKADREISGTFQHQDQTVIPW
jgi:norsolorinic acid ketoreductase